MKEPLYDRLCSYLIAQRNELNKLYDLEEEYIFAKKYKDAYEVGIKITEAIKHIEGIKSVLNQE